MKTTNRVLASLAAISLLAGGSVMAEYDPNKVIDTSVPYTTLAETTISEEAKAFDGDLAVVEPMPVVNFAKADGVHVEDVNGVVMMPLRSVAEALGYTVTWVAESRSVELIRGAHFITMSIDQDAYAFSRRAPQSLGAAPTLVGDSTFVPMSFVNEIIGGWYATNEDGTYKIVQPAVATITEIGEDGSILVEDAAVGEVVLFVGEETAITRGLDRRIYGVDDLKAGMAVEIEYSDVMTASLPPQNVPVRINIVNNEAELSVEEEEAAPELAFSGVITAIDGELVTIGDPATDADAKRLVASDETVITKGLDRRIYKIDDLEVGMTISGTHADTMTMSIPPQTVALTIAIEE